ncbi:MAG: AMP-binding protein [Opitutaceae bacterium]
MSPSDLKALLRATGCAVERGRTVFLCDPDWPAAEREEAERQIADGGTVNTDADTGWLCVRTGGSGGRVKFARHDELTLGAAVRGFCAHFDLKHVNAIDVLPAHHVSGLMARVRCAATGGEHRAWDWKRMEAGEFPAVPGDDWVLSLVPTQLQRLLGLAAAVSWLRQLRIIFLGGGPVWPELAGTAADAQLRVSPGYGMTETAAMIAALQPEEFLAGIRSSGTVMPHARVAIEPPDGLIRISGESVFRGYWPERRARGEFMTEDLGRIDERGHLHILGRRDAMIISGGRKVNAAEVEAALRASGEFADVAVIGIADREWGEVVVACYRRDGEHQPDFVSATKRLAGYQRPKRFVGITVWPQTAQGKVNRAALREMVQAG